MKVWRVDYDPFLHSGIIMATSETENISQNTCETTGCDKEAKLQCPTCIKLQISGSFFCSQECFKGSWGEHKIVHKKAKEGMKKTEVKPYIPWPGFFFTGKLRPFPRGPLRDLPVHIERPDYADHPDGYPASEMAVRGNSYIKQLSKDEINGLRLACKYGREVLDVAAAMVKPGVTTDEIDAAVHQACIDRDCYPSPLNYRGFPKSCCTSVNEVICHGIPDQRPLQDGELLNVDITVYYKGYHGDLNETFFVGKVDDRMKELVRVTYESMMQAIDIVKPGVKYREVGAVIQKHCQAHGFSVVKTYCGHGIHKLFHTAPNVPFYAKNKAVGIMKPGHAFTIEPMVNEGVWKDTLWPDDWTAVTTDGKWSAQFEHTMIVTDTGVEVLTARGGGHGRPHFLDQLDS